MRQVEHNELSEFDSSPMIEAIAKTAAWAGPSGSGQDGRQISEIGNGRSVDEFVSDELKDIIGSDIKPLPQPQDVVLYGFGRIGRLVATNFEWTRPAVAMCFACAPLLFARAR